MNRWTAWAAVIGFVVAGGVLNACVPPGGDGSDTRLVLPCHALPGADATMATEVADRQGRLLDPIVTLHIDAVDQLGGRGPDVSDGAPGVYPLERVERAPWCQGFYGVRPYFTLTVRFSVTYEHAHAGEILTCYRIDAAELEVGGSHVESRAGRDNQTLHVTCLETIQ